MRSALLVALLLPAAVGAEPPWNFGEFMEPVRMPAASAETCEPCHTEQYAAWSPSRHRHSMDNSIFLDGFAAEPHARCVYCHAPIESQAKAVLRWRPQVVRERSLASVPRASLAHEGITCVTCHVRDGVVMSPNAGASSDVHPVRFEPKLREASFCANCHEFLGHELVDGKTVLTDEKMQTTWSEWLAWRDKGGKDSCQDCHMPGKSHAFRGAYDRDYLRGALALSVEREQGKLIAVVASRGVGHAFPTGDVFRHLSLWADDALVARFGQTFALQTMASGELGLRRTGNTSLQPSEPARVVLPVGTRRVRVTYHFADDRHERRGTVPLDDLIVELAALDVPAAPERPHP